MSPIDTTCATVRTVPSPRSATRTTSDTSRCTRGSVPVPRRRSARAFTAGQLARDDYALAVIEARSTGVWL